MRSFHEWAHGLYDSPRFRRFLYLLIFATLLWNSQSYHPGRGYDAGGQRRYATYIRDMRALPNDLYYSQVAYNPPAFYLFSALLTPVSELLPLSNRRHVKLILALMACATIWMAAQIAGWILGGRGKTSFLLCIGATPTFFRSAAMYSPEMFAAFFVWSAMFAGLRSWRAHGALGSRGALTCGLLICLAMWSRPLPMAIGGAWGAAVLLQWALDRPRRRAWAKATLILALLGATSAAGLVAMNMARWGHWIKSPYKGSRERTPEQTERQFLPPEEWHAPHFYYGLKPKTLFSTPTRPHLGRRMFPVLYSDWWGDYWQYWTLDNDVPDSEEEPWIRLLAVQNALALPLAAMMGAGFLALCASGLRPRGDGREVLWRPVALLGVIGLAMFVLFLDWATGRKMDPAKTHYISFLVPCFALGGALALAWALDKTRRRPWTWLPTYALLFFFWSHFLFCLYVEF